GADVARVAQTRARHRDRAGIHPLRHVLLVRSRRGGVVLDPLLRSAVTGLAADAVTQLELRAAAALRDVVGVAVETDLLLRRVAEAEVRGDAFRDRALQGAVGPGVQIVLGPDLVLVERDVSSGLWRDLAVANARSTGRGAQMLMLRDLGLLGP